MSPRGIKLARTMYALKRKIRKLVDTGNNFVIPNTHITEEISTSTEEETLVRIVGNIMLARYAAAAADPTVILCLAIAPGGTKVISLEALATGNRLEGRSAKAVMWGQSGVWGLNETAHNFDIDVKGMRKLTIGDEIQINARATTITEFKIGWFLTMFFKKA